MRDSQTNRLTSYSPLLYSTNIKMIKTKGFTLIELLVVIAVLGVLAGGVFVAINPLKRIEQANDAKIKSDIGQISNASQAYFTTNLSYPKTVQQLVDNGDLKTKPTQPKTNADYVITTAPDTCDGTSANVCTDIIISAPLGAPQATGGNYTWSSVTGQAGEIIPPTPTSTPAPPTPTPTPVTINLVTNPSFEVNLTSWGTGGANISQTRSTAQAMFGSASDLVTWSSNVPHYIEYPLGATANTTYTISMHVYASTITGRLSVWELNAAGGGIASHGQAPSATNTWQRISTTFTTLSTTTTLLIRYDPSGSASGTAYIDGVQIEKKSTLTPYCDGSLGGNRSWSGAPHASISFCY